jgi:hypothetical protein
MFDVNTFLKTDHTFFMNIANGKESHVDDNENLLNILSESSDRDFRKGVTRQALIQPPV